MATSMTINVCSNAFLNGSEVWNSYRPLPSDCFLSSIYTIPCALFWILIFPYIYFIVSGSARQRRSVKDLHYCRLVLVFVMIAASFLDLTRTLMNEITIGRQDLIFYISPCTRIITLMASTGLMCAEWRRGLTNFPLSFLLHFLLIFASGINVYSVIADALEQNVISDVWTFTSQMILCASNAALFVILCFSDYSNPDRFDVNVCDLQWASVLSQLTFWWLNRLIGVSHRKDMQEEDVFKLRSRDEAAANFCAFERRWNRETPRLDRHAIKVGVEASIQDSDTEILLVDQMRSPQKPRLILVLIRVFGPTVLFAWSFKLVYDLLTLSNPLLQRLLISFTADLSQPTWHGGVYAMLYLLAAIVGSICYHQNLYFSVLTGMRIRSALIAAIYRKALRISQETRSDATVGEIVNLMSVDAQRICDLMEYLWYIWSTPLLICICISLLWTELGLAVLPGVGILLLYVFINAILMNKLQDYEELEMELKDRRVKLLSEVLNGIKVMKLYAWEPSYERRIKDLRRKELAYWQRVSTGWGGVVVVWTLAPYLVMLASFATYVYMEGIRVLTAQRIFVSLTLFNMLGFPMTMLPWGISETINAVVSLKRLNDFLNSEDLEETATVREPFSEDDLAVSVQRGSFSWSKDGNPVLTNINLEVASGELVAVVGRVGSGKTSLMSAILGEMYRLDGSVVTRGRIAFVPQESWIQHMSIQDNILFGKEMDRLWYEQVLDACALRLDLKQMRCGDKTEVGERGINLSGGQKQRISLARAVYQCADVYLLDDPLSAVDAQVGRQLMNSLFGPNGLLRGRTGILVTHGLQWLPMMDKIMVLENGFISEFGTYDDLMANPNGTLFGLSIEGKVDEVVRETGSASDLVPADVPRISVNVIRDPNILPVSSSLIGASTSPSHHPSALFLARRRHNTWSGTAVPISSPAPPPTVAEVEPPTSAESMQSGRVSWAAYTFLLQSRGVLLTVLLVVTYVVFTGGSVASNLWLTEWADDPLFANASDVGKSQLREKTDYYLLWYGMCGILQLVFVSGFCFVHVMSSIRASRISHQKMLSRILRAPMSFFDVTPAGRIINRFSKDIETIDHKLPDDIADFTECVMALLASIIVISVFTPFFMAAVCPLAIVYFLVQSYYIPVSRQSRRLDSVTLSPIFQHFTEGITGAAVIRAFEQTDRFALRCDALIDHNSRFYFLKQTSNRWLGFRLELIACLVVFAAIVVALVGRDSLTAGVVGLSISYAFQVTENLNWMVLHATEIETNSVAVERVQEFTCVAQEPQQESLMVGMEQWPSAGRIHFHRYSTRYRADLPMALSEVEFVLKPGEKVGVVGRTGAGKTSLTLALFRLIEASDGGINIDGVEIADLSLRQLRSGLSILPQDPVLFSGSIRDNLDPFADHSDAVVWRALQLSHLEDWVSQQPLQLGYEVGEGGNNMSVGQRQLVCLARSLLRRSKILVLDEATAAVDVETDRLVMETVREQFQDSTIIIIAHRLSTIMDADRILVLERGRVRELDSPENLLRDRHNLFHSLAADAGLLSESERHS